MSHARATPLASLTQSLQENSNFRELSFQGSSRFFTLFRYIVKIPFCSQMEIELMEQDIFLKIKCFFRDFSKQKKFIVIKFDQSCISRLFLEIIIVVPLLYSSVATKFKARKQKFSMHALSFPTRRSRVYLHSFALCQCHHMQI